MVFYFNRIIIVRGADLSDFFSLIFVGKMCVFVSRPLKIVTFLRKNGETPKRVVDFPRERDTFRNKNMEIVEDFDEKKLQYVRDQVYMTCCCEFLVRSAFLSLVWHMHGVCLLHGHVAHSSHYG